MDQLETLLYEERGAVAIITLNRPDVLNAFNLQMQYELRSVWASVRENHDVRAVILTGAGERAFCTGIDREEGVHTDFRDGVNYATGQVGTPFQYNDPGTNILPKQNGLWKPVIAAVNGMACGGALYFLGEADIIIAAEHATFFDPHVTYGMVAGFESVHLLQKLPLGETLRIALLGAHERMTAERACAMGLVQEVVPAAELIDRAMWVGEAIASAPVMAIQGTLRAIWMAHETHRRQALDQVSTTISAGTDNTNLEGGAEMFATKRIEWRRR
jgi:enoyl-CoA hydratase/carnithine racemase